MYTIEVSGIVLQVTNKQVKNMRIVLYAGAEGIKARVSAPMRAGERVVRAFVTSKISWIIKHKERFDRIKPNISMMYVDGESHPVFGREHVLRLVFTAEKSAVTLLEDGVLEFRARHGAGRKKKAEAMDEWYRMSLKAKCPEYILKWEQLTGLKVKDWGIKSMKSRWGSCNTRASRIWLNLELAKWPLEWLDYVVLHEILHLKERNHGRGFKALLDRYMPGWRNIRRQMKTIPLWRED